MSSQMNRLKRRGRLSNLTFVVLVLASGCSGSNAPDFAEFTVDFAREVLAAWLF